MMEFLKEKLQACGWRDDMKVLCRTIIEQRGRDNVTVEELKHSVGPKGRSAVPDSVKADILAQMKEFVQSAGL
jgi:enhancer of yellow 2 transcription factor